MTFYTTNPLSIPKYDDVFSAFWGVLVNISKHCSLNFYSTNGCQNFYIENEELPVSNLLCEKDTDIENIHIHYYHYHTKYIFNLYLLVSKLRERSFLYLAFFVPPVMLQNPIHLLAKSAFILTKIINTGLLG